MWKISLQAKKLQSTLMQKWISETINGSIDDIQIHRENICLRMQIQVIEERHKDEMLEQSEKQQRNTAKEQKIQETLRKGKY